MYYYNARYYDPALGRFVQADTLMPSPGNPQSLNRYAYAVNNPVRYTDPSGHFTEDEIEAYLEGLGYNKDERDKIIAQWRDDDAWWDVIGPDGATYGDLFDGIEMLFGIKTGSVHGFFAKDEDNQTFRFVMEHNTSAFNNRVIGTLVDFYSEASDILWLSRDSSGNWTYRGGTGLAADGAKVKWNEALNSAKHTVFALGFGIAGTGGLAVPEPTSLTKALAVVSFIKCGDETIKAASATRRFARSIHAHSRLVDWVD